MNKQGMVFSMYGIVGFPILIYFILVAYYSVNIPWQDDFENILYFANADLSTKWQLLFAQHNEHRLFFNRIVTWFFLNLTGHINLLVFIYLANFTLVVISAILMKNFTIDNHYGLVFLPLTLLVFNIQHWETMMWAMGGLQNYSVILFALLAIYFFNKWHYWGFILGLLFAVLASYTSANGLLIFFIFIFWLAIDFFLKQIDKKLFVIKLSIVLLISTVVIIAYFYDYVPPAAHPKIVLNTQFIHYFLVLLGNYTYIIPLATLIGMMTFLMILFLVYRGYYVQNPLYFYFILFLLGSSLMLAAARSGFGLEQAAMSSRYKIVSLLLAVCVYLAIAEILAPVWRKKWIALFSILALLLNISSAIVNLPFLERKYDLQSNGLHTWQINHKEGLVHPNQEHSSMILQTAMQKGIYTPPVLK